MRYHERKPSPLLGGFVDTLWSLCDVPGHARERLLRQAVRDRHARARLGHGRPLPARGRRGSARCAAGTRDARSAPFTADPTAAVVRYQVLDVECAIAFYTRHLGFELTQSSGPVFATVSRGDLHLLLSGPGSSGSRPMPDGRRQEPGGWNRVVLYVDELDATLAALRAAGTTLRNEVEVGPGGKQIQVRDVEVFWDAPESKLGRSALAAEDVQGLRLDNLAVRQAPGASETPAIALTDVVHALVRHCRSLSGTTEFLRVTGAASDDIQLLGNDLRASELPWKLEGVAPGVLRSSDDLIRELATDGK